VFTTADHEAFFEAVDFIPLTTVFQYYPGEATDFLFYIHAQFGSGTDPASYSVDIGDVSREVMGSECGGEHPPPSSAKVKHEYSYNRILLLCLVWHDAK
jgi:hypothetical protein